MDRDFLIISTGRLLQIIITLLSVRIFSSMLSTAEVGNLFLINALAAFFGLALVNPVGMYINRRLHRWTEENNLLNYFFVFNIYLVLLSCVSIVVVYILKEWADVGSGIELKLLVLFVILNINIGTWNQTIIPSLNMLHYRLSFMVFTMLTLVLGLAFSFTLVKIVSPKAVVWLLGMIFAQTLTTTLALVYFIHVTRNSLDIGVVRRIITRDNFSSILTFSFPLGVTTFFMWMQSQSYRMVIEHALGLEFLGFMGLGIAISSSIAAAVESVVQQLYYPIFYSSINTSDASTRKNAWNSMALRTIPMYLSLTLLISCLAPYLINILANDKFSDAWIYIVFGAWVEFFRMSTNILSTVAHAEMQTKYLIKSYVTGGLIAVIGVYYAAKSSFYDLLVPSVLVVSGLSTALVMYRDMKKIMDIGINIHRIKQSILFSIPFAVAFLFYSHPRKIYLSITIMIIFGVYFTIIQLAQFQIAKREQQ